MKPTPFQYGALKIYWRFHTSGLTFGEALRVSWRQTAVMLGCGAVACLLLMSLSPALAFLAAGFFAGAVVRDLMHYQGAFRMWPINREIYDWKRVAELIESYEKGIV